MRTVLENTSNTIYLYTLFPKNKTRKDEHVEESKNSLEKEMSIFEGMLKVQMKNTEN